MHWSFWSISRIIQYNQIRFKTSMLRSDLCNYSDPYIIVKGTTRVTRPNSNAYDKKLTF